MKHTNLDHFYTNLTGLLLTLAFWMCTGVASAGVNLPPNAPPSLKFAAEEITRASGNKPLSVEVSLEIEAKDSPQSYRIEHDRSKIRVIGADSAGAMYGGLDVAEAIRTGALEDLKTGEHRPFIAQRGIKFNIPLDSRTPTYGDGGDSEVANIPEMWSMSFWHEFLDELARDRYNLLTLWNLNPFASMEQVPEYPLMALNDVKQGSQTVLTMTIQQKIDFWRQVMQYAQDRGISTRIITWNTFVNGGNASAYGLTEALTNPKTIAYTRASVRTLFETYPLLKGIGTDPGENMKGKSVKAAEKESWLWNTYCLGIMDAKKSNPSLQVPFIHRLNQASLSAAEKVWAKYPDTFEISDKYSIAHMYSCVKPTFVNDDFPNMPTKQKLWLELRNDSIYLARWGDPEYARQYIKNIPRLDRIAGFMMGPDGYCWGREFVSTEPDAPRQLVVKKQWYSFMLWGRLSYDPDIPAEAFRKMLAVRFKGVDSQQLYDAWAAASKIIPQVTCLHWPQKGFDSQWYPEGCCDRYDFHSVRNFMTCASMPSSGVQSISSYCDDVINNKQTTESTPLQVASNIETDANQALLLVKTMDPGADKELRLTIGDIKAQAYLGLYYSEKIRGAVDLLFFEKTKKTDYQSSAKAHLENASTHWRDYAEQRKSQYVPQHLSRLNNRLIDFTAFQKEVDKDIGFISK